MTGLVGTLFGLRSEAGPLPGGNGARVAGFALAMVVAMLAAVFMRTHGWLEPSPGDAAAACVEAGLSKEEAAWLIAFERTRLLPEGRVVSTANQTNASTGAFFGTESLGAFDARQSRGYERPVRLKGRFSSRVVIVLKLFLWPKRGRLIPSVSSDFKSRWMKHAADNGSNLNAAVGIGWLSAYGLASCGGCAGASACPQAAETESQCGIGGTRLLFGRADDGQQTSARNLWLIQITGHVARRCEERVGA